MCKDYKGKEEYRGGNNKSSWFRAVVSLNMLAAIVAGGVYYLTLVSKQTTVGYRLSRLEDKVENLRDNKQAMELARVELEQIDRIKDGALAQKMETVNDVEYVNVTEEVMAMLR